MIGFPKYLNTKADYEYIRKHFPKEKWQPHYKALLETKDNFFTVKTLSEKDAGIESTTQKVIEQENADGIVERVQLEKLLDPNSKLLKLGFSLAEVEAALSMPKDVSVLK